MSKVHKYKGYSIIETGGYFYCLGLAFKTLVKAQKAIDSTLISIENGTH